MIAINIGGIGICPKWKSKSETVYGHDAQWACRRLERQYGVLKNCNVSCEHDGNAE